MEFPERYWFISKYVDEKDRECEYDDPGARALWTSRPPLDEDRLRRKLATHESERRVHEMRLRVEEEERRQRELLNRRKG